MTLTVKDTIDRYNHMKEAAAKLTHINAARKTLGFDRILVSHGNYRLILEADDDDLIEFGIPYEDTILTEGLEVVPSAAEVTPGTRRDLASLRGDEAGESRVCDRCNVDLPMKKFPTTKAGRRGSVCRACLSGGR